MTRADRSDQAERSGHSPAPRTGRLRSSLPRFALVMGLVAVSFSVVTLSGSAAFADVNAAACGTYGDFASSSPEVPVIDSCTYTATGNSVLADTFTAPGGVSSVTVTAYGADGGGASSTTGDGGEVSATLPVTQPVFQVYAGGEGGGPSQTLQINAPPPPAGTGGGGGGSGSIPGGSGGLGGTTTLAGQGIPSYSGGGGGGGGGGSAVYGEGTPLVVAGGGGGEGAPGGYGYFPNGGTTPGQGGPREQ